MKYGVKWNPSEELILISPEGDHAGDGVDARRRKGCRPRARRAAAPPLDTLRRSGVEEAHGLSYDSRSNASHFAGGGQSMSRIRAYLVPSILVTALVASSIL